MSGLGRHVKCDNRGQATVEFALLLMLLLTITFGAIELGRVLSTWSVVQYAARDAARTAAVECSVDPSCTTAVESRVTAGLGQLPAGSVTRWSMSTGPYTSGNPVTVRVEHDFIVAVPLISSVLNTGQITVVGTASMRLE